MALRMDHMSKEKCVFSCLVLQVPKFETLVPPLAPISVMLPLLSAMGPPQGMLGAKPVHLSQASHAALPVLTVGRIS